MIVVKLGSGTRSVDGQVRVRMVKVQKCPDQRTLNSKGKDLSYNLVVLKTQKSFQVYFGLTLR